MNSSIFNFEPLRALLRLPVRTHLWHGVLALGACSLVFVCSALIRLQKPESPEGYRAKGTLEEARAIILGDSQLRMLDVADAPVPTQNRALSGSDYEIQRGLLESLAMKAPALDLVVLELDALPLFAEGIQRRNGDYRDIESLGGDIWAFSRISWLEKLSFAFRYNPILRPVLVGPKFELADPYPKDKAAKAKPTTQPADPKPNPGYSVAPSEGKKKMEHYVATFKKSNNLAANREDFVRMLTFCWERGIKVALLMPPVTREYLDARPLMWSEQLADLRSTAQSFAPPGMLEIWDLQSGAPYSTGDFVDPNHVSDEKAPEYSATVMQHMGAFLGDS